jgi:hypothetical protein
MVVNDVIARASHMGSNERAFLKFRAIVRLRLLLTACIALCSLELSVCGITYCATITTFDAPGSTYTIPLGINPAGVTTGYYYDAGFVAAHGFLRAPDGTITTFDAPGATYNHCRRHQPGGCDRGTLLRSAFCGGTRLPAGP